MTAAAIISSRVEEVLFPLVPIHSPKFVHEDLLHYVWKFRLFNHLNLCTTAGEAIEIVHPGQHNTNAGPDFFDARLRIGGTLWAGNVEIHVSASDWHRHRHHFDPAYNNVILHVVLDYDDDAITSAGAVPPTLVLKDRISRQLVSRYKDFQEAKRWVPCERLIAQVDPFLVSMQLSRVLIERMEQRASRIEELLVQTRNDWASAFNMMVARSFGFQLNSDAFEQVARSLPLRQLARHRDSLLQLEALVFGQAGFLDRSFAEPYPNQLREEYAHLKNKFDLRPISGGRQQWKFLRLRPVNFPTLRLAQYAQLLHCRPSLFSDVLACESTQELESLFTVSASQYWNTHYHFGKQSAYQRKFLGKLSAQTIIINSIAPFLFVYGRERDDPKYIDRALRMLEELPAERNSVVEKWRKSGVSAESAFQSQGLLQLHSAYCSEKKCINCSVGNHLLKSGNTHD